jgi:hypothetical protein
LYALRVRPISLVGLASQTNVLADITIYITVSGDTLDLADLPLIIPGLARLLGIDQSRLQLRFFIGNKRQSEQTLELEIQGEKFRVPHEL